MTFFYNLNNKLNAIRDLPSVTHGQLNERDMSRAAKGYEKYGKEGMEALAKAGRDGKALDPIRKKYDKYDNTEVDEGMGDMARKVGGMVKKVAGKAMDTVGHGSDADMIRDLQKKMGMPQTGMKPGDKPNPKQVKEVTTPIDFDKVLDAIAALYGDDIWDNDAMQDLANDLEQAGPTDRELDFIIAKGKLPKRLAGIQFSAGDSVRFGESSAPMSPKQKSFAALAEPKDKITFADKIAGAKKEVDEMLGDVAAEAMKQALGGKKQVVASEEEDLNPFTNYKKPRADKPKVGSVERGALHDIEHTATGRKVTRRVDPSGISVGTDDTPASGEKRGRGRPKGPEKAPERVTGGATKHKGGRKMAKEGSDHGQAQQIYDDLADIRAAAKQAQRGGEFPQGFASRLESVLYAAMTLIKNQQSDGAQVREEEIDEKAVSKKQQKFMGMVHAAQKGEKPASKEVAKTAKSMGKKDAEDFAATKHKGLPEKKKSDSKKEKTEETADSTPSKGGMKFGGGIYDSMNRDLENMIKESMARLDESMSINMSINNDSHGGPSKSLTVTATDEDAMKLSQLLKSAGLGGGDEGYGGGGYKSACGCGTPDCSCGDQQMDEVSMNQPDYPTETETSDNAMQYAGGLNKPKSTGQSTVPVLASQDDRQHSYAEAEEDALHRMMEMAGMSQNNRLDEGMMDKLKSMLVPKLMKLLGPDAEKIASAVKQATGGDLTPSKENAMKVVQALGIDSAAAKPEMAEGIAGNWQGKLIQALYTLGLLGSAGAAASMWGTVGGSFMAVIGTLLLMFAGTFFDNAPGQVGAMGNFGNKGTSAQKGLDDFGMPVRNMNVDENDDLSRMMEMAGVKKKEVEEEKTDEGNKFTGNLAKARAAGKKEADLDGDGDMEKVRESIFDLTNQWKAYKG